MDTTLIDNYINGNLKLHRAELASLGRNQANCEKKPKETLRSAK